MVRAILSVIVGLVLTQALVILTFAIVYPLMGADGAYKPGSWDASGLWIAMSLITGLIAAVVAGLVCALIARRGSRAPMALAGIVFALGVVFAVVSMTNPKPDPGPRTGTPTFTEAAEKSRQPKWVEWAFPVIGAAGVLIGARLRGGMKAAPPAAAPPAA